MSIERTICCDVCGTRKGETNHWWGAHFNAANQTITYRPWTEWGSFEEMTFHICGQVCALRLHERYLGGQMNSTQQEEAVHGN